MRILEEMLGSIIVRIEGEKKGDERMIFHAEDGRSFRFHHEQDCCESVVIEDVVGDLVDLLHSPILIAEEVSSEGTPLPDCDSGTWTFYKFATMKGHVTVRWLGISNGYYSETVDYMVTQTKRGRMMAKRGRMMGSKNKPGKFDCYANAHPDEPMFVILGRDPTAYLLVTFWIKLKLKMKGRGTSRISDAKIQEALSCAAALERWAKEQGKDTEDALEAMKETLREIHERETLSKIQKGEG